MTETELLVDCLKRMKQGQIRYMLTGSMVSNFWGIPRSTHDLDFVIQLAPAQVPRLLGAFESDFYLDEASVRAAYQPPYQFNALDNRSALKVDFWMLRPVPFEREMFARRVAALLFSERAWIATAEDIILHKLYWHRITPSERQLGDAAGVASVQRGNLDLTYLRRWARELEVAECLEDVLAGKIPPKTT